MVKNLRNCVGLVGRQNCSLRVAGEKPRGRRVIEILPKKKLLKQKKKDSGCWVLDGDDDIESEDNRVGHARFTRSARKRNECSRSDVKGKGKGKTVMVSGSESESENSEEGGMKISERTLLQRERRNGKKIGKVGKRVRKNKGRSVAHKRVKGNRCTDEGDVGAEATPVKLHKVHFLILEKLVQEAVDALLDNGIRGRPMRDGHNEDYKSFSDVIEGKEGRFRETLRSKWVNYSGR